MLLCQYSQAFSPFCHLFYATMGFTGTSAQNGYRGVTFDETTHRLYIAARGARAVNNILVYKLNTNSDERQPAAPTGLTLE